MRALQISAHGVSKFPVLKWKEQSGRSCEIFSLKINLNIGWAKQTKHANRLNLYIRYPICVFCKIQPFIHLLSIFCAKMSVLHPMANSTPATHSLSSPHIFLFAAWDTAVSHAFLLEPLWYMLSISCLNDGPVSVAADIYILSTRTWAILCGR